MSLLKDFCQRDMPAMGRETYKLGDDDEVFLAMTPEELKRSLPSYDHRRALISKDSLASVDGFRLLVLLA